MQKKIASNEEVTEDMRKTVAEDSEDEISIEDSDYSDEEESEEREEQEDELDMEDILARKKD